MTKQKTDSKLNFIISRSSKYKISIAVTVFLTLFFIFSGFNWYSSTKNLNSYASGNIATGYGCGVFGVVNPQFGYNCIIASGSSSSISSSVQSSSKSSTIASSSKSSSVVSSSTRSSSSNMKSSSSTKGNNGIGNGNNKSSSSKSMISSSTNLQSSSIQALASG
jgi:hypothetical protein